MIVRLAVWVIKLKLWINNNMKKINGIRQKQNKNLEKTPITYQYRWYCIKVSMLKNNLRLS